jgi:hypothetical protein
MPQHLVGRGIKPGFLTSTRGDFIGSAGEAVTIGKLLYISGVRGDAPVLSLATSDGARTSLGALFLCRSSVASGGPVLAGPYGVLDAVDTSAPSAVGDPVYLSTAGGVSLTPGASVRVIGHVTKVGVSGVGRVFFNGFGGGSHSIPDGGLIQFFGAGTTPGDTVLRFGGSATEGLEYNVFEATISPAAVETAIFTVPTRSYILAVQANCQVALIGGGTTVTWSIGVTADTDKYGTAGDGAGDTLAKNSKLNFAIPGTLLTATEPLVLGAAVAGGATDGNTALTVGSVRVRVVYATLNSLDDAP